MIDTLPLSIFRYCPRCGSTDHETPSVKLFACRSCGFRYFQNAAAAVIGVIQDPAGRVLFTRREREPSRGKLDLPGGFVDPQETAEVAVAREIREETGLDVVGTKFLASFTNRYEYRGVTYYTLDLVFQCAVADLRPLAARDEVTDVLFLHPSEIDENELSFESVRAVMRTLAAAVRERVRTSEDNSETA